MVNQKIKQRAIHRAKIIKGQLEGLIRAIEQEGYCTILLHQSFAIQRSLKSLEALLLENHLRSHVAEQLKRKDQIEKVVKELIEVYALSGK